MNYTNDSIWLTTSKKISFDKKVPQPEKVVMAELSYMPCAKNAGFDYYKDLNRELFHKFCRATYQAKVKVERGILTAEITSRF
ncbi:MAG: hypothetical protein BHV99_06255 [Clostridium sp. 26_21]|nr:MAG: hypothetical protein BHV99_06255 [Clostridium sp. 26_21]